MDYESFVAYSCMAIVLLMVVLFLRWIGKDNREQKRRREEFEKRRIEIENAMRRGWEEKDRDANGFAQPKSGGGAQN